ncbi:Hypothetical protein A7982_10827 [Minicystis rosea]|nr:Hypothetical protein A7982_10827 [Minicystis rosea]
MLIGIDAYAAGAPLGGAVNDIDAMQAFLRERAGVPAERITRLAAPIPDGIARPTEVPARLPTRANILAALDALAGEEVAFGDRVLIHHAGHGTHRFVELAVSGQRRWHEALVPTDNRIVDEHGDEREQLVFDWELERALLRIEARTPAITVILDCCCSAGMARDAVAPGTRARRLLPSEGDVALPVHMAPPDLESKAGLARSWGRAMVVAACLDNEIACESPGPIEEGSMSLSQGALTRALLEALQSPDVAGLDLAELRWGRIWRRVAATVETAHPRQHPWLSQNPARRVLGGPPEEGDIGYALTFDAATSTYRIDAGALADVTRGAVVAVYGPLAPPEPLWFPPLDSPADRAARKGVLPIAAADAMSAISEPVALDAPRFSAGARGRLIQAGEAVKLAVAFEPDDPALAARLAASGSWRAAKPGEKSAVTLVRRSDGSWALTDDVHGSGEKPGEPTWPFISAEAGVARERDVILDVLEHHRRYSAPLRLAQRCTEREPRLRLDLLDCRARAGVRPDAFQDPPLPEIPVRDASFYELTAGLFDEAEEAWIEEGDCFCVRVENTGDIDLWVTLFDCDSDGRVSLHASRLLVPKRSRATVWLDGRLGEPFMAALSEGQAVGVDRLVAIGTTNQGATLDAWVLNDSFADVIARRPRDGWAMAKPDLWTAAIAVVRMVRRGSV